VSQKFPPAAVVHQGERVEQVAVNKHMTPSKEVKEQL